MKKKVHNIYIFPLLLMTGFAVVIMILTLERQRRVRYRNLVSKQMIYADMAEKYIRQQHLFPDSLNLLSKFSDLLPEEINFGIWTPQGELIYDNEIDADSANLHALRLPEIDDALKKGEGNSIRISNFLNKKYAYYARKENGFIIRIAIPFSEKTKSQLRPDVYYTGMMVLIFLVYTIIFSFYHFRFRAATKRLKFALSTYMYRKRFPKNLKFIDSELNEIMKMFVDICNQLEENEKSMSAMTNNIAHELRTPVTSIRGLLETLMEYRDISIEKKYEYLERAYSQTIRLSEILQDTVLLSKTAEAPEALTLEDVNIYDLVIEMLEDMQEVISQRQATIDLKIGENTVVRGSRTLLYSIFRNLMSNSLKYAGDKPKITILENREDEQFYYFTFYDNGNGVDTKYLNHIFDRFYRINESRSREKGGSGLGLAIVRDAVKFHLGKISAINRNDGGLEFKFSIAKNRTETKQL